MGLLRVTLEDIEEVDIVMEHILSSFLYYTILDFAVSFGCDVEGCLNVVNCLASPLCTFFFLKCLSDPHQSILNHPDLNCTLVSFRCITPAVYVVMSGHSYA